MKKIVNNKLFLFFTFVLMAVFISSASANDEAAKVNEDDEAPYSEAQKLIFSRPHLLNIKQPAELVYNFKQVGTHEGTQEFTDSVSARVKKTHDDGTRDLSFEFLSGDREETYPDIDGFRGNPVLMLFLEWDVAKMEDTPGALRSQNYFRNKMRVGFWKHCDVQEVDIEHEGKQYSGKRVTMQPYGTNQADRELASIFADKEYEFIFVDEIPGEIYQISTKVLAGENESIETTQMIFNTQKSL